MRMSFFSALLTALVLHVVGLAVLSFGWQAWHVPVPLSQPSSPVLMAVVPVPEPTPPPQPESPPESVLASEIDAVSEPLPPTPLLSAPITLPKQIEPTPPKRVETRPKPAPPSQVAPAHQPKLPPARERLQRPAPVTSARRESTPSPPPGPPNEPMGSAGSGSPGAVPAQETPQRPAPVEGTDVGRLFARGDVPVALRPGSSGTGDSDQRGAGSSGEGDGPGEGSARTGAGRGAGGGAGTGRGGAGGGGASARPVGGYQVKPRYPDSARRQGIEGTALLKMRITEQGRVEDVQVERSAGHPDLDESAMEAVRRWRFDPARRDGEPVAIQVTIPIVFKLQ
jgi:protein TonB